MTKSYYYILTCIYDTHSSSHDDYKILFGYKIKKIEECRELKKL
jgi:hypothetical protein